MFLWATQHKESNCPKNQPVPYFGLISQNAINIDTSQTQTEWYTSYIVSINSYACTALPQTVRYVLHLYTDLIHHSKVLIFIDRNKSIQMCFPAIPLKFLDTVWVFMYMYKL